MCRAKFSGLWGIARTGENCGKACTSLDIYSPATVKITTHRYKNIINIDAIGECYEFLLSLSPLPNIDLKAI